MSSFSAAEAIGLKVRVKGIPRRLKKDFTERAARTILTLGGNDVRKIYFNTKDDRDYGDWGYILVEVRKELRGHYPDKAIQSASFSLE